MLRNLDGGVLRDVAGSLFLAGLYDEAAEAEENLRTAAEEKGVKLSLTGDGTTIKVTFPK